jgi:hypothetical protein
MTKSLNNRLILYAIAVFIITNLGFYKTYLIHFPSFKAFATIHHLHGMLAMSWILMLVVQPIFIKFQKYEWHKWVGRVSYITMPLLLLSLFFVAREGYLRNIKTIPETEALAGLTNGIPDMFFMGTLYVLAMYHRKNTPFHIRFIAATGLMIIGPGLGRFLIVLCGFPVPIVILFMILSTTGVGIIWLIMDIRAKKSAFPMGVFVLTGVMGAFINISSHSAWWQSFAKWVVNNVY